MPFSHALFAQNRAVVTEKPVVVTDGAKKETMITSRYFRPPHLGFAIAFETNKQINEIVNMQSY